MTTPLRRRFQVDTELLDKVAPVDTLNRAALLTTSAVTGGQRYLYLTPDDYTTQVNSATFPKEFAWLQAHFGQDGGAPADCYIINWNKTPAAATAGRLTSGVLDSNAQQMSNFNAITAGTLNIQTNTTMRNLTDIDLSGAANLAAVATAISSKLTGGTVAWDGANGRFVITSSTTGTSSTVTLGTETPLSGLMKLASSAGGYSTPGLASTAETMEEAIDDAISLGVNWYVIEFIGDTAGDIADQLALAQVNESFENKTQCILKTSDPNAILANATSDIGYQARAISLERTSVIYHPAGTNVVPNMTLQRPDAAIAGKLLWTDAGARQWDYQALTLVSDSALTDAQQVILRNKGYNFIETFTNTTFTHMYPGRTCTDREIRVQWGADWFDNNLQASLASFAFRTPLMAFDEETFTAVESLIREWLERAVDRRVILDDYTVALPDPDSIPAAVRKSGIATFNDVYQATINSAIDGWTIRGNWSIGGI